MIFEINKDQRIVVNASAGGVAIESSNLRERCPYCGSAYCYFSCDQSQHDDKQENEAEVKQRQLYNAAIDGLESLIIALVGVGVASEDKLRLAITEALDAIGNRF